MNPSVQPSRIFSGTQSWFYREWNGVFYDEGATSADFLRMYAQEFPFVEVDTSFYATPKVSTLATWAAATPEHFRFAFKVPREITHERCFSNVSEPLAQFFAAVMTLGAKLGPVLFQLPPQLDRSIARDLFTTLARRPVTVQCAIEFRNPSWFASDIFTELDKLGVAAAAVDGPFIPLKYAQRIIERATVDFQYVRLLAVRGSVERFDVRVFDREHDLRVWAELLHARPVEDIFITSSNYYEGFAPETIRRFLATYGYPHIARRTLRQGTLFE